MDTNTPINNDEKTINPATPDNTTVATPVVETPGEELGNQSSQQSEEQPAVAPQ